VILSNIILDNQSYKVGLEGLILLKESGTLRKQRLGIRKFYRNAPWTMNTLHQ
jgi:hypothetical protein